MDVRSIAIIIGPESFRMALLGSPLIILTPSVIFNPPYLHCLLCKPLAHPDECFLFFHGHVSEQEFCPFPLSIHYDRYGLPALLCETEHVSPSVIWVLFSI